MIKSNGFIIIGLLSTAVLSTIGAMLYGPQPAESQQQQQQTTENVNFTRLFERQLDSSFMAADARVVYQSPTTVILEGDLLTLSNENGGYIDNYHLWEGVDIVKSYGYSIDVVTISGEGTGDNPLQYNIIMSGADRPL
ncbi:MAG: hypothetical protein AB1351_00745 [Thermoproteota archaeon]